MEKTAGNISSMGMAIVSHGVKAFSNGLRAHRNLKSDANRSEEVTISSRITKALTYCLVLGIFAFTLFVVVAPRFGFAFLIVTGGSMEPALPAGSIVVVQHVASSQIDVGDIVAYRPESTEGSVVTHRVSEVLNQEGVVSFQTRGDANEQADMYPVPSSRVVGKVQFQVPFVGFILNVVRQPVGYILLIGLPSIAIIIILTRSICRQTAQLKARKQVTTKR